MVKEEKLKRSLHKTLLLSLKIMPTVTSFCFLLSTIFAYFDIETPVISYLAGMSLFPWLFIFLSTYVFKFCEHHRMFLYYILVINSLNIVDYYIGIPINNFKLVMLHFIITGIFLFIILYLYVKHHKKLTKFSYK